MTESSGKGRVEENDCQSVSKSELVLLLHRTRLLGDM